MTFPSIAFLLAAALPPQNSPAGSATAAQPRRFQEITVFHGPDGGFGGLARYEANTGRALPVDHSLAGLQLLNIELVGRTQEDSLNPAHARVRADLPGGVQRLLLPGDLGNLYHFHHVLGTNVDRYGYLWVPPLGKARIVLERDALPGSVDPFLPRVAVDESTGNVLLATTVAAGGDLIELDLPAQRRVNRTQLLPPLDLRPHGYGLGAGWGYAVTTAGVLRFGRDTGVQADWVPGTQGAFAFFGPDSVLSENGTAALVVAGTSAVSVRTFALLPSGPLFASHSPEQNVLSGGFLPDTLGGPFLSISDDGQHIAWCIDTGISREVMMDRIDFPVAPVMASGDANLLDTLEEVGRIRHSNNMLTFFAGEPNLAVDGRLEAADLFVGQMTTGGAVVLQNATNTMGDNTQPFYDGTPTLAPMGQFALPSGQRLIFDSEGESLWLLDPATANLSLLEPDIKELTWVESDGDRLLLSVVRRNVNNLAQVLAVPIDGSTPPVVVHPGSTQHLFPTVCALPAGGFGFVADLGGTQNVHRYEVGGPLRTWPGRDRSSAPARARRKSGSPSPNAWVV
ncbi:MAG: hypothetical protein R3F17_10195 [Planctomycetota bacterium]